MPVTGNGRYGSSRVLVVLVGSGMVPGVGVDPNRQEVKRLARVVRAGKGKVKAHDSDC